MGALIRGKAAAFGGIALKFWHTADSHPRGIWWWYAVRVFLAQIQLSLPGLSWPMIEVHSLLRSSIQSRMSFLEMYKVNFDKQQVIMNVSFQPRHNTTATNHPPKRMYLQYVMQFVYLNLLYSHHVFFDFEWVDTVHTDLSRHFTFQCRQLIPLYSC